LTTVSDGNFWPPPPSPKPLPPLPSPASVSRAIGFLSELPDSFPSPFFFSTSNFLDFRHLAPPVFFCRVGRKTFVSTGVDASFVSAIPCLLSSSSFRRLSLETLPRLPLSYALLGENRQRLFPSFKDGHFSFRPFPRPEPPAAASVQAPYTFYSPPFQSFFPRVFRPGVLPSDHAVALSTDFGQLLPRLSAVAAAL